MDEAEQSEATFPMYHGEVQSNSTAEKGDTTARKVKVHDLRHAKPQHYLQICESVQNPTQRSILTAIADKGTAEYKHVESYTNVSRRTIRNHIQDLEDKSIITKEIDAIMTVSYPSQETALLVEDALAMFFASV